MEMGWLKAVVDAGPAAVVGVSGEVVVLDDDPIPRAGVAGML